MNVLQYIQRAKEFWIEDQYMYLNEYEFPLGPVCFVGIEFHFNNYNLDKTN
jgi:hypothetical protein